MDKAINKACLLWHEWRYGTSFEGTVKELWGRFNRLTGIDGNPYKGILYEYLGRIADDRTRRLEEIREWAVNWTGDCPDAIIKIIDDEYTHKDWIEYSNRKT